jgi:hypothetical protein
MTKKPELGQKVRVIGRGDMEGREVCSWNSNPGCMDDSIGMIGTVTGYHSKDDTPKVEFDHQFRNGRTAWFYTPECLGLVYPRDESAVVPSQGAAHRYDLISLNEKNYRILTGERLPGDAVVIHKDVWNKSVYKDDGSLQDKYNDTPILEFNERTGWSA